MKIYMNSTKSSKQFFLISAVVFISSFFSASLQSDTPMYDKSSARDVLNGMDSIVIGLKIGGKISNLYYERSIAEYSDEHKEHFFDKSVKQYNNLIEDDIFLILRVYKGDLSVGDIVHMGEYASLPSSTNPGGKYVLFLHKAESKFFYDECGVVDVSKFKNINRIKSAEKIIDEIVRGELTPCLSLTERRKQSK